MADNLTVQQRSFCMSRVKNRDTGLELLIRSQLHARGLRFRKNVKQLPGSPDIVFVRASLAVFIDGDFWHGFRFPLWRHRMAPFWQEKIAKNRARDRKNFLALRRQGWRVLRIWQHEIKANPDRCVQRIVDALAERRLTELTTGGKRTDSESMSANKLGR